MKQYLLSSKEVLAGYDAVSQLYPHVPSICIWRAWEYAVYQRYTLPGPMLDIGCGDGRFLRLVWPQLDNVVGVDMDASVVKAARQSNVYRELHVSPAHQLPVPADSFASAFANCSLEHMDHLPEVLSNICQSLHSGGQFLCSVVTDKFVEWSILPLLVDRVGASAQAQALQTAYESYHHLVNPFPLEKWARYLDEAGLEILEYIPIMPEMSSYLFLFIDHLWHVRQPGREVGDALYPYLRMLPNFTQGFRQILAGVLQMERDWSIGSGVIFLARRHK
jgi:SAM-dependent methyltransferase